MLSLVGESDWVDRALCRGQDPSKWVERRRKGRLRPPAKPLPTLPCSPALPRLRPGAPEHRRVLGRNGPAGAAADAAGQGGLGLLTGEGLFSSVSKFGAQERMAICSWSQGRPSALTSGRSHGDKPPPSKRTGARAIPDCCLIKLPSTKLQPGLCTVSSGGTSPPWQLRR